MKTSILYFAIFSFTLGGCIFSSPQNLELFNQCPAKPQRKLEPSSTKMINLTQEIRRESNVAKPEQYLGYIFTANAGQKLMWKTPNNICIWVYGPDNLIVDNFYALPKSGEYTIQISSPKGSMTFDLEMALDLEDKEPITLPELQQIIKFRDRLHSPPMLSSIVLDKLLVPIVISVGAGYVVVLFQIRSLKELIKERRKLQKIGILKKFWTSEEYQKTPTYHIIFSINQNHNLSSEEKTNQSKFQYLHAFNVVEIEKILKLIYDDNVKIQRHLLEPSEPFLKDWFKDNIIIIGGEFMLPKLNVFCSDLALHYRRGENEEYLVDFNSVKNGRKPQEKLAQFKNGKLTWDYGTITRIKIKTEIEELSRIIIMFDGNYQLGVGSAIKFATKFYNNSLEAQVWHNFNCNEAVQQILVEATNHTTKIIVDLDDIGIETRQRWEKINCELSTLQNHVKNLCDECK